MKFPYWTLQRRSVVERYKRYEHAYRALEILRLAPGEMAIGDLLYAYNHTQSDGLQEIFALANSRFRQGGFFVEFGACDGIAGSNTYLLETRYGWRGILAEPAKVCHDTLRQNRRCDIDTRCIWRASGAQISFSEHTNIVSSGLAVTLTDPARRVSNRHNTTTYPVETLSLNDLLAAYAAPAYIDYLSIDTEGSEFEILNAFDFDRHQFGCLSVEHHFQPQRESIHALLTSQSYTRVCETISGIDDWYVASRGCLRSDSGG